MSGVFFTVTNGGEREHETGFWWVEARNAADLPVMYSTAPPPTTITEHKVSGPPRLRNPGVGLIMTLLPLWILKIP